MAHSYNTRRSLFALGKNPTPIKRPPAEEEEGVDEEAPLPIQIATHVAAQTIRMKQQDKNFMYSGDEDNAKQLWKSILQSLRVTLRSAHPDYMVLLDTSQDLPPGQYFQTELLRHLYDVLYLITKGKAHGLITTDSMEALADGRLALVMINEVVSPVDQHRGRELTKAVANMQITADEPPAASMQKLVSMREELCVVSSEQLPNGQLAKDLLNALSFEFEVTRRTFRDDEAPGLHRVQREVTEEYNTIMNRRLGAGKKDQMHAFAAETRGIRFPDVRARQSNAKPQERKMRCFICDGEHGVQQCSWLPAVRDMVKNALTEGLPRPAAAAAAVGDVELLEGCEEGGEASGYYGDIAYGMAAAAGDSFAGCDSYEEEDWLQNVRT